MSDIKQAVANIRRNRTGAGSFVSGDVANGTVQEAEVKIDTDKDKTEESDDKNDE